VSLTIRRAHANEKRALEDLQRAASLANEGDREYILANPDAIDLPQEQIDEGRVIVAERDGAVVGFAVVLPREDGDADLDGLFVDPARWRQGIASRLVDEAGRLARARGARAVHVVGNPHARAFYESQGFVQSGEAQTRFAVAPNFFKPL
jgi:GNAT superfamily N-acetyltransferase